jgi:ribosome-associated protein
MPVRKTPTRHKKAAATKPSTLEVAPGPSASAVRAELIARAALNKKAEDVMILDVRGLTGYAEFVVISSGTSERQVSAVAEGIEKDLKEAGHRVIGVEGHGVGHWVLLDYGDVVAHVFESEVRAFYDLEGLWADAPREKFSA